MNTVTDINELRDKRIDRAMRQFYKTMQLYRLGKLKEELEQHPERFTAHVHRLRVPLPSKC